MGLLSWAKRRFVTSFVEARGIEKTLDNIASLATHARRMRDDSDVDDLQKAIRKAVKRYKKLKDAGEKQRLMNYVFKECQQSAQFLSKENEDMTRIFHETIHVIKEMREEYGTKLYQNIRWLEKNELSSVDAEAARKINMHYTKVMQEIDRDLGDYKRSARRKRRRKKSRGKVRWMRWFVGSKRAEKEINQDADEVKKIIRGLRDEFAKLREAETIDVDPKMTEEAYKEITDDLMDILAYLEEIVLDYYIVTANIRKEAVNEMVRMLKPVYSIDPLTYKRLEKIPRDMDKRLKSATKFAYKGARKAAA